MPFYRELSMKLIYFLLVLLAIVSTGLWMAGYLEQYEITYIRFAQASDQGELEGAEEEGVGGAQDLSDRSQQVLSQPAKRLDIDYDLIAVEQGVNWSHFPSRTVTATGYTAGYESTGKHPGDPQYGITYSGVQVRRDLFSTIAADLDLFPLGTILYIPNYGYGVVADIGGAIRGEKIDLYFETVEDVYALWGKQDVEVFVIQEGAGYVTEAMLDELNHSVQVFKSKPVYR